MKKNLEIDRVFLAAAADIIAARQKGFILHHTSDTRASGNETEIATRQAIKEKIPNSYYLGHGHILDADTELEINPQFDLIIAENSSAPVLFQGADGTEYFAFETIYCVGEIKSTFDKSKKQIEDYIKKIKHLKETLKRDRTPSTQISADFNLDFGAGLEIKSTDKRPYKNPLFTFMIFANKGDFSYEKAKEVFALVDDIYLPNVICILDYGIIVKSIFTNGKLGSIEFFPEFIPTEDADKYKWVFIPFGNEENRPGINFAFLIFAINQHLKSTLLLKPDLLKYFNKIFQYGNGIVIK
ncbi:MAG: hypothetical protein HYU68_08415 [Bacteroidetes bacterium]|nr:hypothetical protein [Bacteroidota bacterium]